MEHIIPAVSENLWIPYTTPKAPAECNFFSSAIHVYDIGTVAYCSNSPKSF
jgi:hypothetical protein